MSLDVDTSVEIDASPQRVWDLIMDPRRLHSWVTMHEKASRTPARLSSGSSFEQTLRLAGKSFDVRWSVVSATEPRFAEWIGRGPNGSRARVMYQLEPLGRERTRFTYRNEFELPGGLLGRAATRLVGSARVRREAARSLANLKQLLEREAVRSL
jgi:uncharacterized protein YndB with AHSA1/START domain